MTVKELIAFLSEQEPDREVMVWMPGTYIALSPAGLIGERVLIEGNVAEAQP